MDKDYRYDPKTRTYIFNNGDIDIYHISDAEFEKACKPYLKHGLAFMPPSYEWRDYPDVGFSILYKIPEGKYVKDSIVLGHSKYRRLKNGGTKSEAVVTTRHTTRTGKVVEHQYIIDTIPQMRKLIEKFFKVR